MGPIKAATDRVRDCLRAELARQGVLDIALSWAPLAGGRTNLVWRLEGLPDSDALICRLSVPGRGTPLFPNLPKAEVAAMTALSQAGIAPEYVWSGDTSQGQCLIYRACEGDTWHGGAAVVGGVLARLHSCAAPDMLRRIRASPRAILDQGTQMLAQVDPAKREKLLACRPSAQDVTPMREVFLHGDPVPGNIVMARGRAVLIDWQCPAIGDPIHDLAIFLSPAMQVLGRGLPLSDAERADLFDGYGDPAAAARHAICETAFSWRMAVYCAWRLARGHDDYAPALAAELERLHQLR